MKITHEYGDERREGEGDAFFFLGDNAGSFFSNASISKYNGLIHYSEQGYIKTLAHLAPALAVTSTTNKVTCIEQQYEQGAIAQTRLAGGRFLYTIEKFTGELLLDLDIRPLDDEGDDDRYYDVQHNGDQLLIRYHRHDFEDFLVVLGVKTFREIGAWQECPAAYDQRRGDKSSFWVFRAGAILVNGSAQLVIARGKTAAKASAAARQATASAATIVAAQDAVVAEGSLEQNLALASLEQLCIGDGVIAGLPWFRNQWSRDELISLGGLVLAGRYTLVKKVLLRYARLDCPFTACYPNTGLLAADSLGWFAHRIGLLLDTQPRVFSKKELVLLHDRLIAVLAAQTLVDGLVVNGPGETWMDAAVAGDDRSGARIEIQAGRLMALTLLARLAIMTGKQNPWSEAAQRFAGTARAAFFKNGLLLDGVGDVTQRPNIFLAYYLAPGLLPAADWQRAFDFALERLWLPWGGLASIDTQHPLFQARYTGVDNRSYHRGDSWYWVNALAALCLRRLDAEKWAETIRLLRKGCVRDLLWQGAAGCCSEVSSAAEQEWGGCFSQAWSAAMLYELLEY